jgi:hypothetical protein
MTTVPRLGNQNELEVIWDCEGTARGYPMHPTGKDRTHVPSPVLDAHHTATTLNRRMTCVTSLPRQYQPSQGGGRLPHEGSGLVQLTSKARPRRNHDLAKYGRVAFQLISRHVKPPRRDYDDRYQARVLNVEADHRVSTKFYPVPPARHSARRHRISPVAKYVRSE